LPADLATKNVNNVRILSLSYDSALLGANDDVANIGRNLVKSLVSRREYEPLWEAPIVLVGYSFGGLVVKSLVVEVDKRVNARIVNPLDKKAKQSCTKFLNNLKGTIFYGVPHTGGGEDFKQFFVRECQRFNDANKKRIAKSGIAKSGILKNIEGFNRQMAELSVDFETAVNPTLIIYAFGEGRPVRRGESVLVPYASAQYLARRNHYKVEDATHITICQPTSKEAINYSLLKEVLAVVMEGTQRRTTPRSTHTLSQLRFHNRPSEISSSSNTTVDLENLC
jgi:pimeloyl-ACP methyl ester carboxylesterase